MRKICIMLAIGGTLVVAGASHGQSVLTNVWKVDGEADTFFPASGDTARGMALNPFTGNLLIASRSEGAAVRRIDADTGDLLDPDPVLPGDYDQGGLFPVNKVGVADDGVIYVANLALTATGDPNFVIYRHADEATAPTVAYTIDTNDAQAPFTRLGDGFAVHGSGVDTLIAVGAAGSTDAFLFTTTDGETFTFDSAIDVGADSRNIKFDPEGDALWHRVSGGGDTTAYALDGSGAVSGMVFGPVAITTGAFDVAYDGNERFHAGVPGNFGSGNSGQEDHFGDIIALSDPDVVAFRTEFGLEHGADSDGPGSSSDNLNAAGDAVIDLDNGRVYFNYTNNSYSAWEFEITSVGDWTIYTH